MQSSGRVATSFESSCLSVPAVAFLGLTNAGSPASVRCLLSSSNEAFAMKTSPRTSNRSGAESGRRSGMVFMVLMFCVMSSPVLPSPRVTAYSRMRFL